MASVDIGQLICSSPKIRGGRPCVAGTGVSVVRVVGWYKLGLQAEEIAERIGHLSLAQIHAALTYYHANRDLIESQIAKGQAEAEHLQYAADNRRVLVSFNMADFYQLHSD